MGKMDELLEVGAAFDWISPLVKTLWGFNVAIETGNMALIGQDILKNAGIPCTLDSSPWMDDCYLCVRKQDQARARQVLNAGTQKSG